MKRRYNCIVFFLFLFFLLPTGTRAAELLIPGGQVIGLQLLNNKVTVAAFDDALGQYAKDAGLRIGDEIVSINGQAVSCAEDVRTAMTDAGATVSVTICRDAKTHSLELTPQQTADGPRLGIYLKQGVAGIGTVTWYDPGRKLFGALGHGVNDNKGNLTPLQSGNAFAAEVVSVKRGACGNPGQLKGNASAQDHCGTLIRNTPQGVFGKTDQVWRGEPLPIADYDAIHTGAATIRSTIAGSTVQEYSVEILKIYPEEKPDGRNFLLKVTDPQLLAATSGIVQGMSGSPIIQDGKLVGAVTHVLVNDPTRGYGIFIENMLEAAE